MSELRQFVARDGTTILTSPLLQDAGFPHAFSTRLGPHGSEFDLSRPGQSKLETPPETCEKYLKRFAQLLDPDHPRTVQTPLQVHGCGVVDASDAATTQADTVISNDPGSIAAIRTADCVGILLACRKSGTVAAVHAGWRGILADAPGVAILAMSTRCHAPPESFLAAIGPAIGVEAYEIGAEVAKAFQAAGLGSHLDKTQGPKTHLNLHSAAISRLQDAGIPSESIDGTPLCTFNNPKFFSFRADGLVSGRLLAGIASIRPGPA
jgi:YfiH family protein